MYFGFQNITVEYGKKPILQNLTLHVPRGKIVTLIGQNGCGKSTLLKTVSRAVTQKSGSVIFNDRPITSYRPKELAQKIAYLAQIHTYPPDIDVYTLVSYGRYPYTRFGHRLTKEDTDIIRRAIAMTGLEAVQTQSLSTLSGGERQRAWIAMTVAQEPEILILDEPTTYLDIGYQIDVLELVHRLNRTMGITILMVLHDLNIAARYSDCLYALKDRSLCASGSAHEVLTADNLRNIFGIEARIYQDDEHNCPFFIPLQSIHTKGVIS